VIGEERNKRPLCKEAWGIREENPKRIPEIALF